MSVTHFNPAVSKCRHGNTFKDRCIECEIVSLRALIKNAQANIERWTATIAELQRTPPQTEEG